MIGVDQRPQVIDRHKDAVTHVVALDSTDAEAMKSLPLADADTAIVAIGEDEGASIMATALLKQLEAKRIICRVTSPLQQTVLEAMDIKEFVYPEADSAERLANRLDMKGVVESFKIGDEFNIIEATVPEKYIGKTIGGLKIRTAYNIILLTIIRKKERKNLLGMSRPYDHVVGVVGPDMHLKKDDVLVLFGTKKDIEHFMKK